MYIELTTAFASVTKKCFFVYMKKKFQKIKERILYAKLDGYVHRYVCTYQSCFFIFLSEIG